MVKHTSGRKSTTVGSTLLKQRRSLGQQYDIADPKNPKLLGEIAIPQPNMMKLTPDSRRLYVTNSLLSSLDGNVRFGAWLINVGPDGIKIDERFKPDFVGLPSGPGGAHDMLLK